MSEAQQSRTNTNSSMVDLALYDDVHSSISISSIGSMYSNQLMLESRAKDASSATIRYVTENTIKMTFTGVEAYAFMLQLRAFINRRISTFEIVRETQNAVKRIVFVDGATIYSDDQPEMVERCANSLAVFFEENDNSVAFFDYGTALVLDDESPEPKLVYAELEMLLSALVQMCNNFMRFDGTAVRSFNRDGGTGRGNQSPAQQPSLRGGAANRRPGTLGNNARPTGGMGANAQRQQNTAEDTDSDAVDDQALDTFIN